MATDYVNLASMDDDLEPIDVAFEAASSEHVPAKPPIDEASGFPMLSRRAMLGGLAASTLAMSGMMLLPKERGGVLFMGNPLGAEKAYAGSGTVWSGSFSFKVVGAYEVGIQIMDVSGLSDYDEEDIEKKGTPVEDATVTLTSLFNDQVVSDQTDEEGKVILPIRELAFYQDPSDGVFRANCTLSVTTEDARVQMRDFSTGRVCFEGATGYVVGVHELEDDDSAYMERCTFDDWDIHYSKLTFLRSATNTEKHTIKIRARGMADNEEVDLEILNAADTTEVLVKKKTAKVKLDSSTGLAECTFTGNFLQPGDSDCISEDDAILRITLNASGKSYVTDIEMFVEDTPFDEVKLTDPLLPIVTDPTKFLSIGATGDWPCFNGLSLSVLGPFPKIQVSTTIFTTFVGFGSDIRFFDDNGKFAPKDCWKQDHQGNMVKRYQNMMDRQNAAFEQRKNAGKQVEMETINEDADDGSPLPAAGQQQKPFLGVCQVNLIGRIALFFQWNGKRGDESKLNGEGTVELGFSASGTLTLRFMAGPVPMYLSGTLGLTALGYFNVAVEHSLANTVKELDCKDMKWAVNGDAGLLLKILLSISLGVGYKGLVSLSFDATFTFPFNFAWGQASGQDEDDPRITIGVTILLEIVLQAGLFRLSGQIYSYQKNDWYDSWHKNKVSDAPALTGDAAWNGSQPRFRMTHPDGTFRHTIAYDSDGNMVMGAEDPWSLAVPTTDAMMKGSKEANATRIGGNDMSGLSAESLSALREQHIASFKSVDGQPGVFMRAANADGGPEEPTTVFVGKMPKAVVNDDGEIVTELVDCEGANTFYFGETTPEMIAAAVGNTGAASATRPVKGTADTADSTMFTAGTLAIQEGERFEGDPLLGFALGVTPEYEYKSVGDKTTGALCDPAGIEGIADHDGVVPRVNAIIYRDIHSDPRQRVADIGGTPYLFRIMTVEYPTANNGCYCRSRVVASKFEGGKWGEPTVLEYNTGNSDLPRVDIYDYEFDIAVRTGSDKWTQDGEACLIVTGGLRPYGDDTSFYDAVSRGTVAVLVIDKDLNVLQCMVRGVQAVDSSDAKLGFREGEQHMVCSPCIVDGFAPDGASGSLAFAFLRRSANTSAGVASSLASVTFCVGHCYVRDGYLSIPTDIKEDTSLTLAADVFGMKAVVGDAVEDSYDSLLTLVINRQNGYDVCTAAIPPNGDFSQLQIRRNIASTDTLPEIQPWPHHGTFLFVKERQATEGGTPDYHLYQGSFDPLETGLDAFTPQQVDMAGLKGASFCVSPNGEFIFYYENFHDIPDEDSKTDSASNDDAQTSDDSVHRIMASRYLNGGFCEDFPFCEIDHPIDHIEVLNLAGDASSFVATHLKDLDNSLADLHYIGVPNVLAAEIEAFVQTQPFVCAGHPASFSMDVRNHGNLIIGGFDVQMLDPDNGGALVDTVRVNQIDPAKINPTAANMGWGSTSSEEPQLTDEEEQGMLMPGKMISYQVKFNIPDSWEGAKKVVLRIINAWSPDMQVSGMMAAADDASGLAASGNGLVISGVLNGVHHYHKAKESGLTLTTSGVGDGTMYDPEEWVGTKPSPSPSQDDTNNKSGGSSKGTSAKTGDNLGPMGPLALAAAGAAALAAGYSARRLQNEREARKARESGEGEET